MLVVVDIVVVAAVDIDSASLSVVATLVHNDSQADCVMPADPQNVQAGSPMLLSGLAANWVDSFLLWCLLFL